MDIEMEKQKAAEECAECNGETIQFRGRGSDLQYRICTKKDEPGHLTQEQINEKYKQQRNYNAPSSGRFA